jgi:hypothetical protein
MRTKQPLLRFPAGPRRPRPTDSLAEALAGLGAGRATLENDLTEASIALWQARQALAEPAATTPSLQQWRARVHTACVALLRADGLVQPEASVAADPAASPRRAAADHPRVGGASPGRPGHSL